MEFTADELWSRVLEATRDRLQGQTYRTWLAGTAAVGVTDSEILVEVPSQFHVEWIGDRYGPLLKEAIQQILGRPLALTFRCADPAAAAPIPTIEVTPQAPGTRPPATAIDRAGPPPSLNRRYAFERFVGRRTIAVRSKFRRFRHGAVVMARDAWDDRGAGAE